MKAILVIVGLVVVFFAGFGAGKLGSRDGGDRANSPTGGAGEGALAGGDRRIGSGAALAGVDGGGAGVPGGGGKKRRGLRVSGVDDLLDMVNPVDWVDSNIRIREALAGMSSSGLRGLLEEIDTHPEAMQQQWMLYGAIGKAWAESDLEGALEYGQSDESNRVRQSFLPAVVLELSKKDPGRAEEMIKEIPNRDIRMNLMNQLASVLVETSPEKAIGLVLESSGRHGSWMMNNIYQRWASDDLEAAMAYIPKITNSEDRHGAVQAVARSMALEDLEGALAWVNGLGSSRDRSAALQSVTGQLAMMDVHKALEMVESMPANVQRSEVLGTVMQTWMQRDRAAAMEWFEGIDNPFEKNRILSNIGWELGNNDPVGTIDMALEMTSNNQAHNLLNSAMQSLPDEEIESTAAKITELSDGQMKQTAMQQLVDRWSRSDPVAAMNFAMELPSGRDYDHTVRNAARRLASEDGAAAAKWVMGIEDEERQKAAMGGVINSWADREPEVAATYLEGLSDQKLAEELVSQLASSWGRRDPDMAMEWAGSLEGGARGKAIGKVIGAIAGNDPQTAMKLFDDGVIDDMGKSEAKQVAATIASNIGQWDSEMAVKWAAALPEEVQADAVGNAIRQWVQNSPMAVSEWLVDVPDGEMKDTATSKLVESIERTDPESAFVWAASVGDENQRVELISRVAKRWGKKNEVAAMEAVLATDLSDEQKAKILKRFE